MSSRTAAVLLGAAAALAVLPGCLPETALLFDKAAVQEIKKIVVLPLSDAPGPQAVGSGKSARGAVIEELVAMGKFQVVSVSDEDLKKTLDELGFRADECYDPAVCAEVGRKCGADAVVCGELTGFGTRQESSTNTVLFVSGGGTHTDHRVGVSLRMTRAKDGAIIYVSHADGFSQEGYSQAATQACKNAFGSLHNLLGTGG
ncbi:MAG: hypothetical protein HZA50_17735 [Planctomycetes bacterium]|nr:hypothetical protein [Planctomycetota bacterium]